MKNISIAVFLFLMTINSFAQTLECDLLRQQIVSLHAQMQANPCDRDYELCMANVRAGRQHSNVCFNGRTMCNAGRGLGQGLTNSMGVKSQEQINLESMLNSYKINCERSR